MKPETSEGRTGGIVIDVPKIKGLSLAVDYWRLEQRGLLGSLGTSAIENNDAILLRAETQRQLAAGTPIAQVNLGSGTTSYKGDPRQTRLPVNDSDRAVFATYNATRPPAQQLGVVGRFDNVFTVIENRSLAYAAGVDIGLKYALPALPIGRFTLASEAAYIVKSYTRTEAGGTKSSRLGRGALARWRGNASIAWRKGQWNASAALYYIGSVLDTGASTNVATWESLGRPDYISKVVDELGNVSYFHNLPSQISLNAFVGYAFRSDSRWFKNTRVRLNVNNVLDREPPLASGGFSTSSQQNLLTGRAFGVEWTRTF